MPRIVTDIHIAYCYDFLVHNLRVDHVVHDGPQFMGEIINQPG